MSGTSVKAKNARDVMTAMHNVIPNYGPIMYLPSGHGMFFVHQKRAVAGNFGSVIFALCQLRTVSGVGVVRAQRQNIDGRQTNHYRSLGQVRLEGCALMHCVPGCGQG